MQNNSSTPIAFRRKVSLSVARLMPYILQGIQLDFFLKQGVTQTQFLLLSAIRAFGHCTMGRLSDSMGVSPPTASGIVERLVKAGYLKRTLDPTDRRQVVVTLTANGHRFFQEFEGVIRKRWEQVLRSLDPNELAAFHDVITKLYQRLQTAVS
ncbi:MAG: MarR family transcriptional regulator [Candidatus Omnitrophica bacterium]|nr:MarR family transcriptional regulator [Candidatus Omnitrophota bacterium]